MDFFNTVSCAIAAAYEAVANKNRQTASNNRLKAIVRSEMGTINRAYIALGKHFYNDLRHQATGDEAVLCSAIDQAQERIQKAREWREGCANRRAGKGPRLGGGPGKRRHPHRKAEGKPGVPPLCGPGPGSGGRRGV